MVRHHDEFYKISYNWQNVMNLTTYIKCNRHIYDQHNNIDPNMIFSCRLSIKGIDNDQSDSQYSRALVAIRT